MLIRSSPATTVMLLLFERSSTTVEVVTLELPAVSVWVALTVVMPSGRGEVACPQQKAPRGACAVDGGGAGDVANAQCDCCTTGFVGPAPAPRWWLLEPK